MLLIKASRSCPGLLIRSLTSNFWANGHLIAIKRGQSVFCHHKSVKWRPAICSTWERDKEQSRIWNDKLNFISVREIEIDKDIVCREISYQSRLLSRIREDLADEDTRLLNSLQKSDAQWRGQRLPDWKIHGGGCQGDASASDVDFAFATNQIGDRATKDRRERDGQSILLTITKFQVRIKTYHACGW